ncbi:uncharacterized protein [Drosophila bipectinata]|uniref:uncharacterized protein n=1 Tax=Drosophila bipectinata TaxID=42026 RepID=UPI001C8AA2FB|nr:uncharacterized protein LOC108125366 isoform X2 [Drosophila bipectinata]
MYSKQSESSTMLNYQNMVEKPHNATKNTEDHSNQSFFIDITVKNKSNQCNNLNINEARSFFEQSGIIGHTKLKDALILNTSKIHIDTDLLNQIRKKSLGFRPQLCGKKNHETIQNNYDDLLINLRKEVCIVNEIVEIEESKIITLHSEIGIVKTINDGS